MIVPVHGWAPFLAEALDGVLGQEPSPDRIVVVDDASPEPVGLHADHAGRCELVRREERGGLARARATGLAALDTDLVAFCDDDDAWLPGKLAAQLAAFDRHPEAVACFGHAIIVGLDGRPTGERWAEPAPGLHPATDLLPALYEHNPLCASSALLRRDAVLAAGGLDRPLRRAEDWDLWLRLLARGGAFVFEPGARVRYRRRPGALSADVAAQAEAHLTVHREHAGLVDAEASRRTEARDLRALADGLIAARRFAEAARALDRAAALAQPPPRARIRRTLLRIPGARAAMGRRDPYRRT